TEVTAINRLGADLSIKYGTADQLIVNDFFSMTSYSVEQFKFTDLTWAQSDIVTLVTATAQTDTASLNILTGAASVDALYGLDGNDTITALAGNDFLFGGLGDDSLDGGADNDWLFGDAGDDNLIGGLGDDTLYGGDGSDFLGGGSGNDSMVGGTGDDTYTVDSAGDVIVELAGDANGLSDYVQSTISYSIDQSSTQGIEDLTLSGTAHINGTGNALNNYLVGNSGNNVLDGLSGADRMFGNAGNDTYIVNSVDDVIYEFAGAANGTADEVKSSVSYSIAQQFTQGVENLTLTGAGNINGTGNAASNALTGNSGANALTGGGGNDTYRGGLGADVLTSASTTSNDTYIWGRGEGADTLTDAGGTDQLSVLAGITADQLWLRHVGNNLELSVIGTADKFTINNWYTAAANQVESVKLSDGKALMSSKVENLVNAMAGFTPPAAGQTTLPANYQTALNPVVAANWV
ncbi:calcium-binding protein, partial [Aquabacterium sp.]|uniref:calcium-binding protein n=1 Tax=Aquabacterium sp. TaxID=1872578 RepID=UPI0019A83E64